MITKLYRNSFLSHSSDYPDITSTQTTILWILHFYDKRKLKEHALRLSSQFYYRTIDKTSSDTILRDVSDHVYRNKIDWIGFGIKELIMGEYHKEIFGLISPIFDTNVMSIIYDFI